jgi:hypothetical protein
MERRRKKTGKNIRRKEKRKKGLKKEIIFNKKRG